MNVIKFFSYLFFLPALICFYSLQLIARPEYANYKEELEIPEAIVVEGDNYLKYPAEAIEMEVNNNISSGEDFCAINGWTELPPKDDLKICFGNFEARFQIKYKPETFFSKNTNLFNNNALDFTYFSRSTVDLNVGLNYGKEFFDKSVLSFFVSLRNKAIWGVPESVARTTRTRIKIVDVVDAGHQHFFSRLIFWARELWLKCTLSDIFNLTDQTEHAFTLGFFPFELGRGISLGAAYAVNPGILGFFSDNTIDQFAPGFKFSGDISPTLQYDIYGAILRNDTYSFAVVNEAIRGQEYGHLLNPERETGRVDFVFASRLQWYPNVGEDNSASFEPYFLYNNNPSQMIEFPSDANSHLCTLGLAGEYAFGNFEWGFDAAKNFGHQTVRGWDRNEVVAENRQGLFTMVNSQVYTQPNNGGQKVVFDAKSDAQKLIEVAPRTALQNNQQIAAGVPNPGIGGGVIDLYNSRDRFRDPYKNTFKGWMAVADAAYWFFDRQLRWAVAGGMASGDENPNLDLDDPNDSRVDGDYKGFIPLQEIYSGDRVQSASFLGASAPRPLSRPRAGLATTIPTTISGFTNIAFAGTSLYWVPADVVHDFGLRPNLLFYWQPHATKAFDLTLKQSSPDRYARSFLGTELNCFMDVALLRDFKFFAVGSLFIPGSHYEDIKGLPLSREQQRILDRLDVTGIENVSPLLSNDMSYTFNIGLEYRF